MPRTTHTTSKRQICAAAIGAAARTTPPARTAPRRAAHGFSALRARATTRPAVTAAARPATSVNATAGACGGTRTYARGTHGATAHAAHASAMPADKGRTEARDGERRAAIASAAKTAKPPRIETIWTESSARASTTDANVGRSVMPTYVSTGASASPHCATSGPEPRPIDVHTRRIPRASGSGSGSVGRARGICISHALHASDADVFTWLV